MIDEVREKFMMEMADYAIEQLMKIFIKYTGELEANSGYFQLLTESVARNVRRMFAAYYYGYPRNDEDEALWAMTVFAMVTKLVIRLASASESHAAMKDENAN